jgi:suppressor of tumorigenicity protein 13
MSTPLNVLDAIDKLDASDQHIIKSYIAELQGVAPPSPEPEEPMEEATNNTSSSSDDNNLPQYSNGEDFDQATTYKMEASDLKSSGDYPAALLKYNSAITSAPPSALLLANRADVLFRLQRYQDAVTDCNEALLKNPDSAKALRIRGRALKELGEFERSIKDLAASQQIDYDDGAAEDLKFVTDKMKEIAADHVKVKLENVCSRTIGSNRCAVIGCRP